MAAKGQLGGHMPGAQCQECGDQCWDPNATLCGYCQAQIDAENAAKAEAEKG